MKNKKIFLGKRGEEFVAKHLERQGFSIIAHNYRKRFGEIDLIAQKNDLIVFVEVKARHNPYIDPAEVIIHSKQRKIIMVAKEFLSTHTYINATYRFDVALVEYQKNEIILQYIENAFTAES